MRWVLVCLVSVLAGCAADIQPKPKSERVSRNGDWGVNQNAEMCFAFTYAFLEDNTARDWPDAFFFFTTFRDGTGREQPSILLEREIPKGSELSIAVAGKRFLPFTDRKRRELWLNMRYEEMDLIFAILKAETATETETVVVRVEPPGAQAIRLLFSPYGFGAALESLKRTCVSPQP